MDIDKQLFSSVASFLLPPLPCTTTYSLHSNPYKSYRGVSLLALSIRFLYLPGSSFCLLQGRRGQAGPSISPPFVVAICSICGTHVQYVSSYDSGLVFLCITSNRQNYFCYMTLKVSGCMKVACQGHEGRAVENLGWQRVCSVASLSVNRLQRQRLERRRRMFDS